MKKMFLLSAMAALLTTSLFWSCEKDVVPAFPESGEAILKSGTGIQKICEPSYFPLYARNGIQVGTLTVSNDDNNLTVKITGDSRIEEVQIQVGSNPLLVPKNGQDMPVPGKISFHGSVNDVFSTSMAGLFPPPPPGGTFDGHTAYIFAHASVHGSIPKSGNDYFESDVSSSSGPVSVIFFNSYTVCCQPKGCFSHTAFGGDNYSGGVYYYNNTIGGSQDIISDEGEIAGTVKFDLGKLYFSFNQGWMFSDTSPEVYIEGYYEPGGSPEFLFSGKPDFDKGIYSLSLSFYPYYKIRYNLQFCN